ncbi:hypothetical protein ACFYSH_08055 [Streptomyces sp. NPDC005791]|jgi:hypothetical protein|uniref:hypothetical protein n=1 Tax=unclassified Streptomyces TaxID=2593676 RepID=UPI0033C4CA09
MVHQDEWRSRSSGVCPGPSREALRPAGRQRRRPNATTAWVWLVVGLGALMTGIAVGHGLLIAAGLVAAGVGGQLFDPDRRRRHRPGHRAAR